MKQMIMAGALCLSASSAAQDLPEAGKQRLAHLGDKQRQAHRRTAQKRDIHTEWTQNTEQQINQNQA